MSHVQQWHIMTSYNCKLLTRSLHASMVSSTARVQGLLSRCAQGTSSTPQFCQKILYGTFCLQVNYIWKEKYNLESCELKTKLLPIKIEELLQVKCLHIPSPNTYITLMLSCNTLYIAILHKRIFTRESYFSSSLRKMAKKV